MELYNSDCLEKMKDISSNSIDILITDLPYAQTNCKWDILIDMDKFWKEVNRICKIDCPMFFFCSVKFGNTLINSNPKNFRYELIWIKSSPCGFLNAKKMPMKKNEMLYVFYRKLPKVYTENIAKYHTHKFIKEGKKTEGDSGNECYGKFNYFNNGEKGYEPKLPTNVLDEGRIKTTSGDSNSVFGAVDRTDKRKNRKKGNESVYEPKLPTNILEFKSEKGKHPTQKPVELIKWVLKYYSNENDLCIDATMGSGSTGVACKEMNRRFIGIELDKDIYETALNRI